MVVGVIQYDKKILMGSKGSGHSAERPAVKGVNSFRIFPAIVVGEHDVIFELELAVGEVRRKKERRSFKTGDGLVEIKLMSKTERNAIFTSPLSRGFMFRKRRKGRRKALEIPVLNGVVELRL
jgi:hypothetical protein